MPFGIGPLDDPRHRAARARSSGRSGCPRWGAVSDRACGSSRTASPAVRTTRPIRRGTPRASKTEDVETKVSERGRRIWRATWVLPVAGPAGPRRCRRRPRRQIVAGGPGDGPCAAHTDLPVRTLGDGCRSPVWWTPIATWSGASSRVSCPPQASQMAGGVSAPSRADAADDHDVAARAWCPSRPERGHHHAGRLGPDGRGSRGHVRDGSRGLVHLEAFGRESGRAARGGRPAECRAGAGTRRRTPGPRVTVGRVPARALHGGTGPLGGAGASTPSSEPPVGHAPGRISRRVRPCPTGEGPLADLFRAQGWKPGRWPGTDAGRWRRVHRAGVLRAGLVAAHCVRLSHDDPDSLAAAGVGVAHCPQSNARLRCGRAPVEALRRGRRDGGHGHRQSRERRRYDVRAEARACGSRTEAAGVAARTPRRCCEWRRSRGAGPRARAARSAHSNPASGPTSSPCLPGARRRSLAPRRSTRGPPWRRWSSTGSSDARGLPFEVDADRVDAPRGRAGPDRASVSLRTCSSTRREPNGWCRSSRSSPPLAFAGVLLVVLGLVFFDGGGPRRRGSATRSTPPRRWSQSSPRDAEAWRDLADQLTLADRAPEAVAPARRAVTLAPKQFENVQALVDALKASSADRAGRRALQKFTSATRPAARRFWRWATSPSRRGKRPRDRCPTRP